MVKYKLIFFFFIIFLLSCSREKHFNTIDQTELLMDTVIRISVYDGTGRPEGEIEKIIEKAFRSIEEIDSLANNYNDSSVLAVINMQAGNSFVDIDSSLYEIFRQSLRISEMSGGAFDVTISPLLQLWGFGSDAPAVPDSAEIIRTRKLVDFRKIILDSLRVKFAAQGMKVDLGGIAKGYAVDRAMRVLQAHGITDALVNAGGDFKAVSSELTRGKRKVWIRHPRQGGAFYGYFQMDNGSVATSGDYERYFFADSVKYHHILDPVTGYPANGCVSVTIKASSVVEADALATAVFVLGTSRGMKLIRSLDGVEGIIIYEDDGELKEIVSKGLKESLHIQH